MSFDFICYLSERLGTTESDANEILGNWLRAYEPVSASEQSSAAGAAGAAPPKNEPSAWTPSA